MIPILYNADEVRFINNGRGRLADATRCIVTEERNGIFELEMDYPITGEHFEELTRGRIIAATHDDKGDLQPFIIYSRTVPNLQGVVTFNAHHISYKLSDIVVMPFEAGSCAAALEGIKNHAVNLNPFNFWTDKTTVATFKSEAPRNARNMLGGVEGSILDVFGGGEYKFDKFDVKLYAHRGQDTDCEIRYGKNLKDLNQKIDDAGTYNAIVPFWRSSEGGIITLPEEIIVYAGIEPQIAYLTDHNLIIIRTETGEPIEVAYRQLKAAPMDLTEAFEDPPTAEQLRAAANARFQASQAWVPTENLKVDFVQLWQTAEFEEYSGLQRVGLCDTVSVYYPQAGIEAVKQKVIKTTYNTLLDRYDSIELGAQQTSLAQAMKREILQDVPTTSMMDQAIRYATDLIRGGLGGYVVMTPGPNGYPQEILIMDTPDTETAVNVWRFNQGGLGHSSSGYQGPFTDIALTQDGKINASMITTGIINANLIRAGVITDESGLNYWNLQSGEFQTKKGTIANFVIESNDIIREGDGSAVIINGNRGIKAYNCRRYPETFYNRYYISNGIELSRNTSIAGLSTGAGLIFYGGITEEPIDEPEKRFVLAMGEIYGGGVEQYFEIRDSSSATPLRIFHSDSSTTNKVRIDGGLSINDGLFISGSAECTGDFTCYGTKSRHVSTKNYGERLHYCYETPTPLFGDIGSARLDEEGICYVDIDDIFTETIADRVEYQVFLQPEGEGTCYIAVKNPRYFVIKGSPGLKVAWELKAKQKNYETLRLELAETNLEEYTNELDIEQTLESYIEEQEGLLYG